MTKPAFIPWTDEEWTRWLDGDVKKELGDFVIMKTRNYIHVYHTKWKWNLPLFHNRYIDCFLGYLWICHFSPATLHKINKDNPGNCHTFLSPGDGPRLLE